MPSTDDFSSAGARAARQPVPLAPPITDLQAEVGRRRTRRRRAVGSSIAGIALLAAIPIAASQIGEDAEPPSLFTAAADDAAPAVTAAAAAQTTTVAPADETDDTSSDSGESHARPRIFTLPPFGDGDFDFTFGDLSFSLRTVTGPEAATEATTAEVAATETREIDGQTVWIATEGDTTTVSALVEGETFIEVEGPTEHIDTLLEFATNNAVPFEGFPFQGFDEHDVPEGFPFGNLEEFFPDGLPESFGEFPEGFPFAEGEFPDLEELLPPGLLEDLERFKSGDLEGFDFDDFHNGRGFFEFPRCDPDADHESDAEGTGVSA
ncbi:MAG: hypothetical protein ACR2P0_03515 [Acidimicrobiales bacterium]